VWLKRGRNRAVLILSCLEHARKTIAALAMAFLNAPAREETE
jgi:hypothetical protein